MDDFNPQPSERKTPESPAEGHLPLVISGYFIYNVYIYSYVAAASRASSRSASAAKKRAVGISAAGSAVKRG